MGWSAVPCSRSSTMKRSSYQKRLWVMEMEGRGLLPPGMGVPRHGQAARLGRDMEEALSFSNEPGTLKSSLGLFVTAETYYGRHGYSLKLDGLEEGVNDNARERLIVLHGAEYVSRDRAEDRLVGRSWGCPAVRAGDLQRAHRLPSRTGRSCGSTTPTKSGWPSPSFSTTIPPTWSRADSLTRDRLPRTGGEGNAEGLVQTVDDGCVAVVDVLAGK